MSIRKYGFISGVRELISVICFEMFCNFLDRITPEQRYEKYLSEASILKTIL